MLLVLVRADTAPCKPDLPAAYQACAGPDVPVFARAAATVLGRGAAALGYQWLLLRATNALRATKHTRGCAALAAVPE